MHEWQGRYLGKVVGTDVGKVGVGVPDAQPEKANKKKPVVRIGKEERENYWYWHGLYLPCT